MPKIKVSNPQPPAESLAFPSKNQSKAPKRGAFPKKAIPLPKNLTRTLSHQQPLASRVPDATVASAPPPPPPSHAAHGSVPTPPPLPPLPSTAQPVILKKSATPLPPPKLDLIGELEAKLQKKGIVAHHSPVANEELPPPPDYIAIPSNEELPPPPDYLAIPSNKELPPPPPPPLTTHGEVPPPPPLPPLPSTAQPVILKKSVLPKEPPKPDVMEELKKKLAEKTAEKAKAQASSNQPPPVAAKPLKRTQLKP